MASLVREADKHPSTIDERPLARGIASESVRKPLSKRVRPESADWDGPFEGVPDWLVQSFLDFVMPTLIVQDVIGQAASTPAFRAMQRQLHLTVQWGLGAFQAFRDVWDRAQADPDLLLDMVDFCLGCGQVRWESITTLGVALQEGGSAWTVGRDSSGRFELQRRIDATTQALVKDAAGSDQRAAHHLAAAWSEIYGRNPSASEGYREAVRAVETAAIPVVSPNKNTATLGTLIADMKAKPSKWTTSLNPPPSVDDIGQVIAMMELLWKSQLDRHGSVDESAPLHVTQKEAEAALHLSATLVHWFQSGAVIVR